MADEVVLRTATTGATLPTAMDLGHPTRVRAGVRTTLAIAVAVVGAGSMVSPAAAAERCRQDPEGDLLFPDAAGGLDLVRFCVDHAEDTITFSVEATRPFSAADVDQVSFELDLAADRNADAFVNVVRADDAADGLTAVLQTAQGQTLGLDVVLDAERLSVSVPAAELAEAGWSPAEPYDVSVITQTSKTGIDRIPNPWLTIEPVAASGWPLPALLGGAAVALAVAVLAMVAVLRRRGTQLDSDVAWSEDPGERARVPRASDGSDDDEKPEDLKVEER